MQDLQCPSNAATITAMALDEVRTTYDTIGGDLDRITRVWIHDGKQPALAGALQALHAETRRHLDALDAITEQLFAVTRHTDHDDLSWDEVIARLRDTVSAARSSVDPVDHPGDTQSSSTG